VYIEATASDWESAHRVARKLRAVGIAKVRGFMLNATHYDWTRANIRYGLKVSRLTGGKHFVINTAENGRGPVHVRQTNGRRLTVWCNPGLRGLGPPPTTDTSHPKVDAYLWINRPGYAQSCQGRKIAWYLPRALSYARYATDWEGPPAGTSFGHFKRPSNRALNIP
jgi:endoglucanase